MFLLKLTAAETHLKKNPHFLSGVELSKESQAKFKKDKVSKLKDVTDKCRLKTIFSLFAHFIPQPLQEKKMQAGGGVVSYLGNPL